MEIEFFIPRFIISGPFAFLFLVSINSSNVHRTCKPNTKSVNYKESLERLRVNNSRTSENYMRTQTNSSYISAKIIIILIIVAICGVSALCQVSKFTKLDSNFPCSLMATRRRGKTTKLKCQCKRERRSYDLLFRCFHNFVGFFGFASDVFNIKSISFCRRLQQVKF
jgi:hypothetical protein